MIKSYGQVILQKGSILYHTSDEKYVLKNQIEKAMLFCTLHPSEWDGINKYITFIKLKKDVSLLFMIEEFQNMRIYSSLNKFTNHPNLNLAKKHNKNLLCYVEELKKENLEGWFTSIENKASVEVSLINDINIFEVLKTKKLERNWRNGNILNNKISIKNWGQKYKICSDKKPIVLNINSRFKDMIKKYKKYEKKSKYINEHIFQVILKNAKIFYHEGEKNEIIWKCA